MYHECRPDQPTDWAAMGHVAKLLGISTAETLRKCGNDSLIWPHRDGLIWPRVFHAGAVVTV